MKKLKFLPMILIIAVLTGSLLSGTALALDDPEVLSRNAIVIDMSTGEAFYSLNADQKIYPASTTKIMTVLLAVEAIEDGRASVYDEVTASSEMTRDLDPLGSSAGIIVGETMTLENLLYGAMLASGNDAANVIAEHIGGTIDDFVALMNNRAAELGCANTHFVNPHGLFDEQHYTTPEDFAKIAMEASQHELFMEIANTPSVTIPATNYSKERNFNNSNALICPDSVYGSGYLYGKAAGIKTGFTSDAGYCLVSSASNGEIDLLAGVFGGYTYPGDDGGTHYTNFEDSITLYDWVFDNFSYQEVLKSAESVTSVPVSMGADAESVSLRPQTSLVSLLPNDCDLGSFEKQITVYDVAEGESLTAPISAGEVLGEVSVSYGGVNYGTVKLVAASGVDLSRLQYIKSQINETIHSTPAKVTVAVLAVLAAAYLFLVIRYRILHTRHMKAVRAARLERERRAASGQTQAQTPAPAPADTEPEDAGAPPINYFNDEGPVSDQAPTEPETLSDTPIDVVDEIREQTERDYFEEFFRQK